MYYGQLENKEYTPCESFQTVIVAVAHFRFVNGRCHFKRSMPSLVTKLFGMDGAISALV